MLASDVTSTFTVSDPCTAPSTPIPAIQGSGPRASVTRPSRPRASSSATTRARRRICAASTARTRPATATRRPPTASSCSRGTPTRFSVGDVVRVSGTVSEFQGQTQISASQVVALRHRRRSTPVDVILPALSADFLERYEGMLVRMPQTLSVTEHFQLGRFGQVTMSQGGRLYVPTTLVPPGAAANALHDENALRSIIVDDATNGPEPRPDPVRARRRSAQRLEHAPGRRHRHGHGRRHHLHVGRQLGERQRLPPPPRRGARRRRAGLRRREPAAGRPACRRRQPEGGGDEPAQLLQHLRRDRVHAAASAAR